MVTIPLGFPWVSTVLLKPVKISQFMRWSGNNSRLFHPIIFMKRYFYKTSQSKNTDLRLLFFVSSECNLVSILTGKCLLYQPGLLLSQQLLF